MKIDVDNYEILAFKGNPNNLFVLRKDDFKAFKQKHKIHFLSDVEDNILISCFRFNLESFEIKVKSTAIYARNLYEVILHDGKIKPIR